MEALAKDVPPGSEGLVSLLGPAPLDLSRPGLRPGGLLFPVPVTFSGLGPGHLARGALENIAYAIHGSCALLEEVTGVPAGSISLGGGMTRTALFTQILANVLGHPVRVAATPDVSAVGAALVAGAALASDTGYVELAARAVEQLREVDPEPGVTEEYEEHYGRWLEAQERLEGFL